MKNIVLIALLGAVLALVVGLASCTLATEGTCSTCGQGGDAGPGGQGGIGGQGGEAGSGGVAGQGGIGGQGGEAGNGGTAGQGGLGGQGGEAGNGGTAGQGGIGGQGGTAGSGGSAGAGGIGGQGGAGGGGDCLGGVVGTVDSIDVTGVTSVHLLVNDANDTESFYSVNPTTANLNGMPMPAQAVVIGDDGISFTLKRGGSQIAKPYYLVAMGTLPPVCNGAEETQACATAVAKSYRCQFAPYFESVGCPPPVTFISQADSATYSITVSGYTMVLIHLTCTP